MYNIYNACATLSLCIGMLLCDGYELTKHNYLMVGAIWSSMILLILIVKYLADTIKSLKEK